MLKVDHHKIKDPVKILPKLQQLNHKMDKILKILNEVLKLNLHLILNFH